MDGFEAGSYQLPPTATSEGEVRNFGTEFGSALEEEANLAENTNDYEIDERVIAGFVMSEINLTPDLMLLPGLRYEHTHFEGSGSAFDPESEILMPQVGEKNYGNLFPAVHLRYNISPHTNIRAAATTALARPNFIDLVPFRLPDDEDLLLGNPDLDPTTSINLDLLAEHYDQRIGVMSAGVFYKRLKDPIFTFVEENDLGGETRQPRNGENASIFGVEMAFQQQLRMLPKPFDGLGVFANYTYTSSETTLPGGREAPGSRARRVTCSIRRGPTGSS